MFTQITTFLASHAIQSIVWTSIIAVVSGLIIAHIKSKFDKLKGWVIDDIENIQKATQIIETFIKEREGWQSEVTRQTGLFKEQQAKVKEHEATIAAFQTDRAIYISVKEDAQKDNVELKSLNKNLAMRMDEQSLSLAKIDKECLALQNTNKALLAKVNKLVPSKLLDRKSVV